MGEKVNQIVNPQATAERISATEAQQRLRTIAQWKAAGVTQEAIAAAFQVTPARISQLVATEEYRGIEAEVISTQTKEFLEVDQAWDRLERKSLANLLKAIDLSKDPDLNLRVAALANRAERRARPNARVIDAGEGGSVAVIRLSNRMIESLRQTKKNADGTEETREVKRIVESGDPMSNRDHHLLNSGQLDSLFRTEKPTQSSDRQMDRVNAPPTLDEMKEDDK